MPLINCKVELKSKWKKHCLLAVSANENTIDNPNIIFTMEDTKLYVPICTLLAKVKNCQNLLVKDLKNQLIKMNIQQKVRIKIGQTNIDISLNPILLELIDGFF